MSKTENNFTYNYIKKNFSKSFTFFLAVTQPIEPPAMTESDVIPDVPAMTECDVIDRSLDELVERTLGAPTTQEDAIELNNRLDLLGGQIERTSAYLVQTVKSQQQQRLYSLLRLVNQRMNGLSEKVNRRDRVIEARYNTRFAAVDHHINIVADISDRNNERSHASLVGVMTQTQTLVNVVHEQTRLNRDLADKVAELMVIVSKQEKRLDLFSAKHDELCSASAEAVGILHSMVHDISACSNGVEGLLYGAIDDNMSAIAQLNDRVDTHTYDLYHIEGAIRENGQDLHYVTQALQAMRDAGPSTDPSTDPSSPPSGN